MPAHETTFRPGPAPGDVADAIRSAMGEAEDAAHLAGCPPGSCSHVALAAVVAFLRALPDRIPMPRPGGVTWGHSAGETARLAALVEASKR